MIVKKGYRVSAVTVQFLCQQTTTVVFVKLSSFQTEVPMSVKDLWLAVSYGFLVREGFPS